MSALEDLKIKSEDGADRMTAPSSDLIFKSF